MKLENKDDQSILLKIGRLIRGTRKHLGMNQSRVAQVLDVDQSALSRIEAGKQVLTAPQWFGFCGFTGISLDSLTYGTFEIPTHDQDGEEIESMMKLPARYRFEKHTRVRSLLPLLQSFRTLYGEEKLELFLRSKKIDPDFFLNLSAQINFNFEIDLMETLLASDSPQAKDPAYFSQTVTLPENHGSIRNFFSYISEKPFDVVAGWVNYSEFYDRDFSYEVLERKANSMKLSIAPNSHMKYFKYRNNAALGDFLCQYQKGYFSNLSSIGGQTPLSVNILENQYLGAKRCLFQLEKTSVANHAR